jgi:hypothetical protein
MDSKAQKEIEDLRTELSLYKNESVSLKKAIWDMLNYANMFVLILDKNMVVKLCNYSLATAIGFKSEKEMMEKCWLDFIPEKDRLLVEHVHTKVKVCEEQKDEKYKEVINDILLLDGRTISVRWFNMCINHSYQMSFSIGVTQDIKAEATDESIRSYYRDIVDKDRTMIQSIRDLVLGKRSPQTTCSPSIKV